MIMIDDWIIYVLNAAMWACFIGFHYRRSWGLEHGVGYSAQDKLFGLDRRDTNTQICFGPLLIPVLLLIHFTAVLLGYTYTLTKKALAVSLSYVYYFILMISVFYVILLLLLPLLRRYFSARACATLWLLPVFSFICPTINLRLPRLLINPNAATYCLLVIWATGFVSLFTGCILSHLRLRRTIRRTATAETDPETLRIWQEEMDTLGFITPVRLVHTPAAHAPFSIGHTKKTRMCILPIHAYTERELRLIFRHELHHLRRRDTDSKLFFVFCGCLCWFNPLVHLAIRRAADDLELSCDEIVLEHADEETRNFYAELLLNVTGERRGFTTCLSARATSLRYRLKCVMHERKTAEGSLMLMLFMFLFLLCRELYLW